VGAHVPIVPIYLYYMNILSLCTYAAVGFIDKELRRSADNIVPLAYHYRLEISTYYEHRSPNGRGVLCPVPPVHIGTKIDCRDPRVWESLPRAACVCECVCWPRFPLMFGGIFFSSSFFSCRTLRHYKNKTNE